MKVIQVAKDAIIYFEEKSDNRIYVIRRGKVELRKNEGFFFEKNILKKNIVLAEGAVFGYEEIFMNNKRLNRAVALEECELLYFEQGEFEKVIRENIKIGEKILNSLSKRIRSINDKIKSISMVENFEIETKMPFSDEENIKEIYYYFMKNSEYEKAIDVLERLRKTEKYNKYAEEEIEKIEYLQNSFISEEQIASVVSMYKNDEPEILAFILEGMISKTNDNELQEKILYERVVNLKNEKYSDEFIKEADKFIEMYPKSKYNKEIMFIILEKYQKMELYPEALKYANVLTEIITETYEFEKLKKIIDEIQTRFKI